VSCACGVPSEASWYAEIVYGVTHGRPLGPEPTFCVRTVHLRLSATRPGEARNVWPVRVRACVFQGDFTQTHVTWGERDLIVRAAAMEPFVEGAEAFLSVDPARCVLLEDS